MEPGSESVNIDHRNASEERKIMARKSSTKPTAAKRTSTKRPRAKASPAPAKGAAGSSTPGRADFGDMAKMARALSPEQAFELYKTNAKLALDVFFFKQKTAYEI